MNNIDLDAFKQSHLLNFVDELDSTKVDALRQQIADIDFELLRRLISSNEHAADWSALAARAEPPPAVQLGVPHPEFSRRLFVLTPMLEIDGDRFVPGFGSLSYLILQAPALAMEKLDSGGA